MPQYCAKAMKPDIITMKYIFKYLYFVHHFKTCHSAFCGFVISPSGGSVEKKRRREKKKPFRDEKLFNRRDKNGGKKNNLPYTQ